jgi:hypothetical protein
MKQEAQTTMKSVKRITTGQRVYDPVRFVIRRGQVLVAGLATPDAECILPSSRNVVWQALYEDHSGGGDIATGIDIPDPHYLAVTAKVTLTPRGGIEVQRFHGHQRGYVLSRPRKGIS